MNRKEFLTKSVMLGAGVGLMPMLLQSCKTEIVPSNFQGKVLIIGAGAAGLMAGYRLAQQGKDFQILEASAVFGGRVRKLEGFADFPIDLGAEWIHTKPKVFGELLDNEKAEGRIELISYRPKSIQSWKNDRIRNHNWTSMVYREYKFKNSTWYDFLADFVVPPIADQITYHQEVSQIDYTSAKVKVSTADNQEYEADKVIVTVPLKILQKNLIDFQPALPQEKTDAMNTVDVPPGIKVFIEFSERFYPDMLIPGGLLDQSKLYYDIAFGKDSDRHVLGLFWVAPEAESLTSLDDEAIIQTIITELDEIFDGKASASYQKHVVQNWSKEPFIQGSYSHYGENYSQNVEALIRPIDNKVFFAGEAMINGDSSTVHGAGFSGIAAADAILSEG